MKSFLASIVCVLLSFQTSFAADAAKIEFGQSFKTQSEVMGQEREVNVWLPKAYGEEGKTFPILYVIDGGADQDFIHIAALHQLSELNGAHGTAIVVGIRTQNRLSELTPAAMDPRYQKFAPDAGGAAVFRRYIAEEVIPFIEEKFKASGRRALIGESLAGLFITDTFLVQPELFDDYIPVSPSLWWDDKNVALSAETAFAAADYSDKRIYLTMANEGGTMQGGLDILLDALKADEDGAEWTYVNRSASQTHSTIFHPAALDAFKWLYPLPPFELEETPWYLIEGGQPETDE